MSESTYNQRYASTDSQTAGSFAFDTISAKDYAVSKIAFGTIGSVTYVDASNGLPVAQQGTWNVTNISGTVSLPTGAATAANQSTGNTSLSSIDGKTPALGQALAAASVPVVLTAAQMTTLTPLSTVAATQSGTWNITNVSGTVSLPTGAATAAKQPALGTAGAASSDVITVQGIASMTALKVDGSAVTQPVSIAGTVTVGSHAVTNAGTFAVQESQILADNAGFTDGTTKVWAVGFIYDEVAGTALTENDIGAGRMNVNRAIVSAIEDGSTRGRYATVTASNALKVDASGVAVPITDNSGSLTVDYATTGSGNATGALRVELANNGTGVLATLGTITNAVHVDDNSGSLTVDNGGTFAVQAAQSGTWNSRFQDGSGTALLSAAHALNSTGAGVLATQMSAEFDDAGVTQITENNFGNLRISTNRNLYTTIRDASGNERGANVTSSNELYVVTSSNSSTSLLGGNNPHDGGAASTNPILVGFFASAAAPSDVSADNDAVRAWCLRNGALCVQPTYAGVLATTGNGTSGTGVARVTIASDSTGQVALAAGTNGIGKLTANSGVTIGAVEIASAQTLATVTTCSTVTTLTGSGVASGSSDSGNPHKIGAVAHTAAPTAVTDGQRVNLIADKVGKLVTVGSIRDLKVCTHTTITSSTSETTILAQVASTFLDLYGLILANSSATATVVTIKDATGGTIRAVITVPAGETRGFMLPESGGIPQTTVNNNWSATSSQSISSLEVTALAVKNI